MRLYSPSCRYRGLAALLVPLQPLQVGSNFRSVLVAQISIFLQSLVDDVFQLRRHVRIQSERRNWRPVQDGVENHPSPLAPEWQGRRRHFVQNRTEGKQVGACIEFLPSDLLGRHVSDGAQRIAGTSEMFR